MLFIRSKRIQHRSISLRISAGAAARTRTHQLELCLASLSFFSTGCIICLADRQMVCWERDNRCRTVNLPAMCRYIHHSLHASCKGLDRVIPLCIRLNLHRYFVVAFVDHTQCCSCTCICIRIRDPEKILELL